MKEILIDELKQNLQNQKVLDDQERDLILALRGLKVTWQEIADIYGVTRQAVHSKWASRMSEQPTQFVVDPVSVVDNEWEYPDPEDLQSPGSDGPDGV